jgi:hypothetical protein
MSRDMTVTMTRDITSREGSKVQEEHEHEALVHEQEHIHMTHYERPGEDVVHLTARHTHEHNHPAVTHSHEAHRDPYREHLRSAHVHDHAHPETSTG